MYFLRVKFLIFMENIQKKFREIDLFDFTSFLGLDFLKFSLSTVKKLNKL